MVICLIGITASHASPVTYYDIDFSTPTHTGGNTPTTGTDTDTISSINFGQPVIESSFGALTTESLVFNTDGNTTPCCFYDQIALALARGSDRHQISFDLSTEDFVNNGSGNTFGLVIDTPQVRPVNFNSDGSIHYYHPSSGSGNIGSFFDSSLLEMMVDINLIENNWDISMDDVNLFSGSFSASGGDVDSIRFSFGGSSTTTFDSVGLDNILITNGEHLVTVPEPATLPLMLLGFMGIYLGRRRLLVKQK